MAPVHRDVNDYVLGCDGFQEAKPIPKYKITLRFPMTSLFDTYSIDFAGTLPRTPFGKRYILIAVDHQFAGQSQRTPSPRQQKKC